MIKISDLIFFSQGHEEEICKENHDENVKHCFESIDAHVKEIEYTTTKFEPTEPSTESISKILKLNLLESDLKLKIEERSVFNATNFFIAFAFFIILAIMAILYLRYHKIEGYLRATFTDNVQLV